MTPEQQRRAIHEALGLCVFEDPGISERRGNDTAHWCLKCAKAHGCHEYPDYLNDLKAMHEAENVLIAKGDDVWSDYCNKLNSISCRISCGGKNPLCGYTLHSTAAQRAEAFLRSFNLWKD